MIADLGFELSGNDKIENNRTDSRQGYRDYKKARKDFCFYLALTQK